VEVLLCDKDPTSDFEHEYEDCECCQTHFAGRMLARKGAFDKYGVEGEKLFG
jgi:hypothetical protein